MQNTLLGSDPELMLVNSAGELVSAIPIIPGNKDNPTRVPSGAIQHDNVNLEFGIDPATNVDEWVERHGTVMKFCVDFLKPRGLKMVVRASDIFPAKELDCKEAREFGCNPDFDPYEMDINIVPKDAADGDLRSCGGHVHIGSDAINGDIEKQAHAAKVMDIFLGIPSILLDKDPTSPRRRNLYGKAGAHRPKSYGIEYRALGNFWVGHPKLTRLVYLLVRDGLEAHANKLLDNIQWHLVRRTINDARVDLAEKATKGLIVPLLSKDSRDLLAECLSMERPDFYEAWGF